MTKIAIIGMGGGLAMVLAGRLEDIEIVDLKDIEDRNTYKLSPYPLAEIAAVSMQPRGKGKGDRIRRRQQWRRK